MAGKKGTTRVLNCHLRTEQSQLFEELLLFSAFFNQKQTFFFKMVCF